VGEGQRPPPPVTVLAPPEGPSPAVVYRLGAGEAARRASLVAAVGAAVGLAPLVLAFELLVRLRWKPPPTFWGVAVALGALVVVRGVMQFRRARRRLASLHVTVNEDAIALRSARDALCVLRIETAKIVEIEGPLGGLRIESRPDARGMATFVSVPRGGDGFGEVRAELERWRPIDRRGRRGPLVRLAVGLGVIAAIFFLPFVLEDVVARSQAVAGILVLLAWAVMRWTLRAR
jgi:hypothetical protein